MRHPASVLLLVALLGAFAPARLSSERSAGNPDVFPDAWCDAAETAALRTPGHLSPTVYRARRPFGVVLNYYRFKRKQAVVVSEEDPGARLLGILRALERRPASRALLEDPFVSRFVRHVSPASDRIAPETLADWRARAGRLAGRPQLVGEGERVTIYYPYLSQRTYTLIDETVFILRQPGGSCNERIVSHGRDSGRVSGRALRAPGSPEH